MEKYLPYQLQAEHSKLVSAPIRKLGAENGIQLWRREDVALMVYLNETRKGRPLSSLKREGQRCD